MRPWRYALVAAGMLLLLYGGARLVTEVPDALPGLGALDGRNDAIHDGLLAPLVVGVGWILARAAPPGRQQYPKQRSSSEGSSPSSPSRS